MGFAFLFPAVLFYYEITFRLFTGGGVFRLSTLLLAPLCCAYGGIGYLLCTISRNRRVNIYLTVILLFLSALPFGVEAFLFREFGIFYNFKAIFAGTGDVVKDFSAEIVRLVFSARGLLCIAVYLLPTVLFVLFGSAPERISGWERGMTAARMAAFYALALAAIHMVPNLELIYGEEYSFQASVEQFGLLTGTQLDAREELFGGGSANFEQVDMLPAAVTRTAGGTDAQPEGETDPNASPEPTAEPVVYEPNQLDLPLYDEPEGTSDVFRSLDAYVAGLTPSMKNAYTGLFEGKNLIIITAEAFSREVIDPELTPTLYRLATKGVNFTDYYQFGGAGTTGGEYQHLFGLLPSEGIDSMLDMTSHIVLLNIPTELYARGYYGKAFHNNSYTYYDRDRTHTRLGFSDGYMGYGNGMEEYVHSTWPESDYEMFTGTVPTYIDRQPFNIYYMTVSGHATYDKNSNAMATKHWDQVADLPYSDMVKGYLAANLDLEDAMAYLVGQLEEKGIADDTVICLTADHYPYGLDGENSPGDEHYLAELYGFDVETVFDRDHSSWILWCGSLEDQEPIVVDEPTFSLDILPTMYNLFGLDFDSRLLPGRDVFSDAPALVFDSLHNWKTSYGTYYASSGKFVPSVDESELPDGYVDSVKTTVRNKVNYCQSVLDNDYFTFLFWR